MPAASSDNFPPAELNPELLHRVQQLESELRAATDENIVLVAYQNEIESSGNSQSRPQT
ncbi:hypothetical protein LLE49_01820 [Alicyclobacillus tolerans]|uniref:hypothetical protein n=1 Tax=Alicyclobacillus tolerans TaxID=90970 RepID=UPI001F25AE57|nr:hypothetical protein [Alicyclobacillus tolerans]MCF8563480.1 hypothetical protein [Alicyclobacillus tolerans]